MLTWRDIRVRYKQSVMGFLWALLAPALVVAAGVVVRIGLARFTNVSISTDEVSSIVVRAVGWTFLISSLRFGTFSLISNTSLVTKVPFPRETFPLSAVLSSLFDSCVASLAMVIALFFLGWRPTVHVLLAIVPLLTLAALATGMTLLLSAANLFLRDVKYLVEIILTYAIFVTPVLYEASFVGSWERYLMINPMSSVLEGLAATVVYHRGLDPFWTAYSAIVAALVLGVGLAAFKRLEPKFAEAI
jgi:ABC-type polysaccharide/polyol phosphate export permease